MQAKPKILLLIATLDAAGAEKQIVELARLIDRDMFDVHLCCLTRGGPLEERVKLHGIPYTVLGKKFKLDFSAVFKLAGIMKTKKIDILHTWMFTSNFFGRISGIVAGVPRIAASERGRDIWKTPFHFLADRILLPRTDRVVCVSEGVKEFCMEKYGLTEEKAVVIRNGIEITPPSGPVEEARREFQIPPGERLVLTAGRLDAGKGIKYLVRSMPAVLEKFPEAALLAAGSGSEICNLRREAGSLGISEKIKFLGFRKDIRRLMRASEIFVLPSLYEGLPNVILEAMLEEKPVIASDIPGIDEVVADGETGILVPARSPSALGRAITELLSDREKAAAMGRAGRKRAEELFDISNAVKKYERLYGELACGKK